MGKDELILGLRLGELLLRLLRLALESDIDAKVLASLLKELMPLAEGSALGSRLNELIVLLDED